MADTITAARLIENLASKNRVVLLGGLAVVSHGLSHQEIDLIRQPRAVTKQLTGRDKDLMDIAFLENKAEKRYLAELPATTEERAVEMLERFLTPKVAEAALAHPSETVRQRALSFLRELAAEGDPFAVDILKNLPS